jgi:hypothetical protein
MGLVVLLVVAGCVAAASAQSNSTSADLMLPFICETVFFFLLVTLRSGGTHSRFLLTQSVRPCARWRPARVVGRRSPSAARRAQRAVWTRGAWRGHARRREGAAVPPGSRARRIELAAAADACFWARRAAARTDAAWDKRAGPRRARAWPAQPPQVRPLVRWPLRR